MTYFIIVTRHRILLGLLNQERMMQSKRMTSIGEMSNTCKILVEESERKRVWVT